MAKHQQTLLKDFIDFFKKEEEVVNLRERIAERFAEEIRASPFLPVEHFLAIQQGEGEDVKLELTTAGRQFLDDWMGLVMSWLYTTGAENHTLLDVLFSSGSPDRDKEFGKSLKNNNFGPKLRPLLPSSQQATSLKHLREFAQVRPLHTSHPSAYIIEVSPPHHPQPPETWRD